MFKKERGEEKILITLSGHGTGGSRNSVKYIEEGVSKNLDMIFALVLELD